MALVAKRTQPEIESGGSLRPALMLSAIALLLGGVATVGGLFIPDLYRFAAWLVPATKGQDLVTLAIALPAMALSMLYAGRGSTRASMIWVGTLGYLFYTGVGAAFGYDFGPFVLIYIALFSFCLFGLVATVLSIDIESMARKFSPAVPRRAVALFLAFMGLMLTMQWLARIIPNLTVYPVPESIEPFQFVYAMDLGVIVPLMLLAAVWIWQRRPWGYLLSGAMLIKSATMGLALLSMTLFNWLASQPIDPAELIATYAFIAFGSLGMSVWFFRHCRG